MKVKIKRETLTDMCKRLGVNRSYVYELTGGRYRNATTRDTAKQRLIRAEMDKRRND